MIKFRECSFFVAPGSEINERQSIEINKKGCFLIPYKCVESSVKETGQYYKLIASERTTLSDVVYCLEYSDKIVELNENSSFTRPACSDIAFDSDRIIDELESDNFKLLKNWHLYRTQPFTQTERKIRSIYYSFTYCNKNPATGKDLILILKEIIRITK